MIENFRKTSQELLPAQLSQPRPDHYDIYPTFPLGAGKIEIGYDRLAQKLAGSPHLMIDGYSGVLWENFQHELDAALRNCGVEARWFNIDDALLPEIDALVAPFLGGNDPIFGTRCPLPLEAFFDLDKLPEPHAAGVSIVYGCGAALAGWDGLLLYLDVPKNEIQFRSRAGNIRNLGAGEPASPKTMYKRFYFVDWVVLNAHRAQLLRRIDWLVDEQRPDSPTFISGDRLREGLDSMLHNYMRPRPWFEPGPWGGQWMKARIPELPQDVPNYAWSFEAIVWENGVIFESEGFLLEASFDWLMFQDAHAMLGESAVLFGNEFPIRFDFLDTFGGGNLSVQCHPRPDYIRQHFGENFTQDETYYILDCHPEAQVYLGFREDIDPTEFRDALEQSHHSGKPVDIPHFVHIEPAHRHDLFLIPSGTIHCSGIDNLVLEISATPYIFTFKLYDWLRLDLEGKPRPLNIARAFDNLNFERKGEKVKAELISRPVVVSHGEGWQMIHLPTHAEHFYDVHRLEFDTSIEIRTENSVHVLSLVEGESVMLETANGLRQRFHYAETFIIPAAAGSYRLTSDSGAPIKVVKAFIKPGVSP